MPTGKRSIRLRGFPGYASEKGGDGQGRRTTYAPRNRTPGWLVFSPVPPSLGAPNERPGTPSCHSQDQACVWWRRLHLDGERGVSDVWGECRGWHQGRNSRSRTDVVSGFSAGGFCGLFASVPTMSMPSAWAQIETRCWAIRARQGRRDPDPRIGCQCQWAARNFSKSGMSDPNDNAHTQAH